jgi:Flp pilus assembly protein TadG
MRNLPPCRCRSRRGAIAAQAAIMFSAVLGVAALVLDGGMVLAEWRHAQAAADAAALAAAVELAKGNSYSSAATAVGQANGYASGEIASASPPGSGPFNDSTKWAADTGYVEVIITHHQPASFSGIFGIHSTTIQARAVAQGKHQTRPVNILVLNGSNTPAALKVHGSNSVMTTPGAIVVDSTSNSALTATGSGVAVVSQTEIDVVGGVSGSNVYAPSQGVQTNVKTGQSAVSDPLANLPVPSTSGLTVQNGGNPYNAPFGTTTIAPGIYKGTYSPSGGGKYTPAITVGNNSTVIMSAGVYYLEGGGMRVTGNLDGTAGVMIYNGQTGGTTGTSNAVSVGPIAFNNAVVKLTPMTAAQNSTYKGISIFQDRDATAPLSINGGAGTDIEGAIYAKSAAATITGGSNIIPGAAFITDTLDVGGSSNFTIPTSPIVIPDPTKVTVTLVE